MAAAPAFSPYTIDSGRPSGTLTMLPVSLSRLFYPMLSPYTTTIGDWPWTRSGLVGLPINRLGILRMKKNPKIRMRRISWKHYEVPQSLNLHLIAPTLQNLRRNISTHFTPTLNWNLLSASLQQKLLQDSWIIFHDSNGIPKWASGFLIKFMIYLRCSGFRINFPYSYVFLIPYNFWAIL